MKQFPQKRRILSTVLAVLCGVLMIATPAAAQTLTDRLVTKRAMQPFTPHRGGCDLLGCSEIENLSTHSILIGRDWCNTGFEPSVGKPSCAGQHGDHDHYQWLNPGEHSFSTAWKDTDTFGVGAGCTIQVQWNEDADETDPVDAPFTAAQETWFKIFNTQDIDIESYTC